MTGIFRPGRENDVINIGVQANWVEMIRICMRGRENDAINIGVQVNWVEMTGICRRGRENDVICTNLCAG